MDGREQLNALRLHLEGKHKGEDAVSKDVSGLSAVLHAVKQKLVTAWAKAVYAYKQRLDTNDRSWWVFTRENPIRRFALLVAGNRWFGRSILVLVLASCVVMALDDPGCTDACKHEAVLGKVVSSRCRYCNMYHKAADVLDVFFTATFTIEIILKSIAHNFALSPNAYLKSGWNWIDLLSTASGYLRYMPIGDSGGLSGIRAMRALRPLRALNAIPGLRMLVETLLEAVPLLLDVILLLTWVFFVFGIVALNLFMGKLHRRCMVPYDGDPAVVPYSIPPGSASLPPSLPPPALLNASAPPPPPLWNMSLSGSNGSTLWQLLPGYENDPCAAGGSGRFKCPAGSRCFDINTNPNNGYTSFDNFGAAAYCIFQMLTLDAWTTTLLFPLMDAIGPALPLPYFILLVLFGAFFAMQLLVAILSSKFAQIDAQRPKKKKRRRRRRAHTPPDTTDEEEADEEALEAYADAAAAAAALGTPPPPRPRRRRPQLFTRLRRWWRRHWFHFHRRYLLALRRKDLPGWRAVFWDVTFSIWFNNIMTGFILANTVTLALEHQGMSDGFLHALEKVNLALTCGFILEFCVKHVGVGLVGYWRDPWNDLDGLIVVLSVVEIAMTYGPASGGGGTNTQSLRTFRLLRILRSLKLLARIEGLRKLMRMVLKGFVALKDFMLLLTLFIFIFSILGLQQFGGSPAFAPPPGYIGYPSNFDTLWSSMYTVFQLLTADNWVAISWMGMEARGLAASLYFMAWIVIGSFILLTLFLAILITNFQTDEDVPPTEAELSANPYAPDDQSETASTLGGSTVLGGDDGGGPGNALQQRIARRTDPAAVYRVKKWLTLMGYHHGMQPKEVAEIAERMDVYFAAVPEAFEPEASPSILDINDREADALARGGDSVAAGGGGGGGGALKRTASRAYTLFARTVSAKHPAAGKVAPSAEDAGREEQRGTGLGQRDTGGHGGGAAGGGGGGAHGLRSLVGGVLARRSAPHAAAGRGSGAGMGSSGEAGAEEAAGDGEDRVGHLLPGRALPHGPGRRTLMRNRSAVTRAEEAHRPSQLVGMQGDRLSLPDTLAAAMAAIRGAAVGVLRSKSSRYAVPDGDAVAVECEGIAHDGDADTAAADGASLADDVGPADGIARGRRSGVSRSSSSSPVRRRRAFLEQWQGWFEDADAAPGSGLQPSSLAPTRAQSLDVASSALATRLLGLQGPDAAIAGLDPEQFMCLDAPIGRRAGAHGAVSDNGAEGPGVGAEAEVATEAPATPDTGGGGAGRMARTFSGHRALGSRQGSARRAASPSPHLRTALGSAHARPPATRAAHEPGGKQLPRLPALAPGLPRSWSSGRAETIAAAAAAGRGSAGGASPYARRLHQRLAATGGPWPLPAGGNAAKGSGVGPLILTPNSPKLLSAGPSVAASPGRPPPPLGPSCPMPYSVSAPVAAAATPSPSPPCGSLAGSAAGTGDGVRHGATLDGIVAGSSPTGDRPPPIPQLAVLSGKRDDSGPHLMQARSRSLPRPTTAHNGTGPGDVAAPSLGPDAARLSRTSFAFPASYPMSAPHSGTAAVHAERHASVRATLTAPSDNGSIRQEAHLVSVRDSSHQQDRTALGGPPPALLGPAAAEQPPLATTSCSSWLPNDLAANEREAAPAGVAAPGAAGALASVPRVSAVCSADARGEGQPVAEGCRLRHRGRGGWAVQGLHGSRWEGPAEPQSLAAAGALARVTRSGGEGAGDCDAHASCGPTRIAGPQGQEVCPSASQPHDQVDPRHRRSPPPRRSHQPQRPTEGDSGSDTTGSESGSAAEGGWWWQPAGPSSLGRRGQRPEQAAQGPPPRAWVGGMELILRGLRQRAVERRAVDGLATAPPAYAPDLSGVLGCEVRRAWPAGALRPGAGPVAEAVVASSAAVSAERRARAKAALQAKRDAADPGEDGGTAAAAPYLDQSSFWLLRPQHPLRVRLQAVIAHNRFEMLIMLLIAASSVVLALDSPRLDEHSPMRRGLHGTEWALNLIFAVEMVAKLVLKGCILHPGAYWRNPWDILDGLIVVTSLVSMAAPSIGALRTLRLLRVLRPLRMIGKIRGMRLVVETLLRSLPAVAEVVLFGGFLFGIFAILGTQLFMGRLSRCNQAEVPLGQPGAGEPVASRAQCLPGSFTCGPADVCDALGEATPRAWVTPFRNFDHVGRSLLSLFILATLDGYMDTLQALINAVGPDKQPAADHNPWMGLYVIVFVFLGAFFWLNLLVSVIIDYYSRLMLEEGDLLSSKEAREWMKLFQFSSRPTNDWAGVPVPPGRLRARCHALASDPAFDGAIMAVILANVLVMALPHSGSSHGFEAAMSYFNAAFTLIFIFEMAVKLGALGLRRYIADPWNKLDCFIVLTSLPDLLSLVVPLGAGTGVITVFRILRIGRMFKLIRGAAGLRTLFNTLITSLPAIANVGSLLALLCFMFAVLGMNLYGGRGGPFEGDTDVDFANTGVALVVLFRVFTGDGWSNILARACGCSAAEFGCDTGARALVACMYFCSFVILANFVMLNLVIAVILDNFISSAQSEGLLKTSNFTDVMRTVISLRVFVRYLRLRIEGLKEREAAQQAAAAAAALAAHSGGGSARERRKASRKRSSALSLSAFNGSMTASAAPSLATLGGAITAARGSGRGGAPDSQEGPVGPYGVHTAEPPSRDATLHSGGGGLYGQQHLGEGGGGPLAGLAAAVRRVSGAGAAAARRRTSSRDGSAGEGHGYGRSRTESEASAWHGGGDGEEGGVQVSGPLPRRSGPHSGGQGRSALLLRMRRTISSGGTMAGAVGGAGPE